MALPWKWTNAYSFFFQIVRAQLHNRSTSPSCPKHLCLGLCIRCACRCMCVSGWARWGENNSESETKTIFMHLIILNVASRTNVSRKMFHFYALCNDEQQWRFIWKRKQILTAFALVNCTTRHRRGRGAVDILPDTPRNEMWIWRGGGVQEGTIKQ